MLSTIRNQFARQSIRQFSTARPALVKTLYVGNLSWKMNDDELRAAFEEFGEVSNSRIVMDKLSGRSRGFGFVDFVEDAAADVAVEEMNAKEVAGRPLTVNVSIPREQREPGSYGNRGDGERRSFGSYNDRRGGDRSFGRGSYNDERPSRGGYRSGGYGNERTYDRNSRRDE